MIYENGREVSEQEIIKEALNHLAQPLCFAYETKSEIGNALAFMIDSAIKYGQIVVRGDNVLSASAHYTAYEQEVYNRKVAKDEQLAKELQ